MRVVEEDQTIVVVVENRARETCIATMTLGVLSVDFIICQDNAQYRDTLETLQLLDPDVCLLHGSACGLGNTTMLTCKIQELSKENDGRPVITPISRAYFEQDRGSEFLRRVSTNGLDADLSRTFTALGSGYCLLKFVESSHSTIFPPGSVKLTLSDAQTGSFLKMDSRTVHSLELLNNSRTGNQKQSLFGSINKTRTSAGARKLRAEILRPPSDVDTIEVGQLRGHPSDLPASLSRPLHVHRPDSTPFRFSWSSREVC